MSIIQASFAILTKERDYDRHKQSKIVETHLQGHHDLTYLPYSDVP